MVALADTGRQFALSVGAGLTCISIPPTGWPTAATGTITASHCWAARPRPGMSVVAPGWCRRDTTARRAWVELHLEHRAARRGLSSSTTAGATARSWWVPAPDALTGDELTVFLGANIVNSFHSETGFAAARRSTGMGSGGKAWKGPSATSRKATPI
ncbi:hypothetical protein ACTMU2_08530 [Cupriavidus basilensis]